MQKEKYKHLTLQHPLLLLKQFLLRHRIAPVYFDYLSPIPRKLRHYLYAFEQEAMPVEQNLIQRDTSFGKALICLGVLVGVSAIYVGISYWRQRRRVA